MNVDTTDYIVSDCNASDGFKWNECSTRVLLGEYKRHLKNLGRTQTLRTKKQLYVRITEELNNYGYNLTPVQVCNRFKTLERAFKNRQSKDKSSQNPFDLYCDSELKYIFANKSNMVVDGFDEASKSNLFERDTAMSSDFEETVERDGLSQLQFNENSFVSEQVAGAKDSADLYKWDPETTQLLFDIYEVTSNSPRLMSQFRTKNNLWSYVTEKLNEYGFTFSSAQVLNRVKTLERAYRKYIIKKRESGTNELSFPYERYMKKIMTGRIASSDEDTPDELTKTAGDFDDIDLGDRADIANVVLPMNSSRVSNLPKKSLGDDSSVIREIRLMREENGRFQQEVLEVHRQQYSLLQEENKLLRENNDLLRRLIENGSFFNLPK